MCTQDTSFLEDSVRQRAKNHVQELKGFYSHLITFILVNAGLAALNLLVSPGRIWFVFPLLGWGIGLLSHALNTFRVFNLFSKDWEERKIHAYMEKESGRNPQ